MGELKRKLKAEGAVEVYENIVQLKMTAPDGKKRLTAVADTEQLLRIIQSMWTNRREKSGIYQGFSAQENASPYHFLTTGKNSV